MQQSKLVVDLLATVRLPRLTTRPAPEPAVAPGDVPLGARRDGKGCHGPIAPSPTGPRWGASAAHDSTGRVPGTAPYLCLRGRMLRTSRTLPTDRPMSRWYALCAAHRQWHHEVQCGPCHSPPLSALPG
eukprot:726629-Prymnesium_polylepis.2